MKDNKRFVAYFDEGIVNGPMTQILDGEEWMEGDEWSFEDVFKDELKSLKIGHSVITPESGVTYTVRLWRVE